MSAPGLGQRPVLLPVPDLVAAACCYQTVPLPVRGLVAAACCHRKSSEALLALEVDGLHPLPPPLELCALVAPLFAAGSIAWVVSPTGPFAPWPAVSELRPRSAASALRASCRRWELSAHTKTLESEQRGSSRQASYISASKIQSRPSSPSSGPPGPPRMGLNSLGFHSMPCSLRCAASARWRSSIRLFSSVAAS